MVAFSSDAYVFSAYAVPLALTAVLILAFGTRVLARRVTGLSMAFFAMTFVVAIWMFAFAFLYSTRDARVALFWSRLAYLGVPFIAPTLYWFAIELLRIDNRRRTALMAAWISAGFFSAIAVTTDRLIPVVQEYWWGFYPRYRPSVSALFLTFFFGYLIAAMIELIRAYP